MKVHYRFFLVVPGLMAEVTPASAGCQRCQCPCDEATVCPGRVLCSVPCSADRDHRLLLCGLCQALNACLCRQRDWFGFVQPCFMASQTLPRGTRCSAALARGSPSPCAVPPTAETTSQELGWPKGRQKKNQISFQALALPRWKKKMSKQLLK